MTIVLMFGVLVATAYRAEGFLGDPPIRDTGLLASIFTSFTQTDKLGLPANLYYAFILVRHGMVVPVEKSYPGDSHFKDKWEKGRFTTHGKRMMTKLGRSLATRYKGFIGSVGMDKVYVSTMNTGYGQENAEELLRGLCEAKPFVEPRADIDKFQLLKYPKSCASYAKLKTQVEIYENYDDDESFLFYYLRRSIGETKKPESEWYINSRERVYHLWEILDLERKSKEWEQMWYGDETRKTVRRVVNRYLHDSIFGRFEMAQYVVGPLFQEMMDGYYSVDRRIHIHITNDFTYAAFKSILLERGVELPEFGETLMVEVDSSGETRVYTYKPYRYWDNHYQNLFKDKATTQRMTAIGERVRTDYQFGDDLHDKEWRRRCDGIMPGNYRVPLSPISSYRTKVYLESPPYSSGQEDSYRSGGRANYWPPPQPDTLVGRQPTALDSKSQFASRQRSSYPSNERGTYEEPLSKRLVSRQSTSSSSDPQFASTQSRRGLESPSLDRVTYWDQKQDDVPLDNSGREVPRSFSGLADTHVKSSVVARMPPASPARVQPRSIHSETILELSSPAQTPRIYPTEPRAQTVTKVVATYPG